MKTHKIGPDARNGDWQLFLMGYSNETVRKALLINILTKQQYEAKVLESIDKKSTTNYGKTTYSIIEAIDPVKNQIVEFKMEFTKQR